MRFREPILRVMVPPDTDPAVARDAAPIAKAVAERLRAEGDIDGVVVFDALDLLFRGLGWGITSAADVPSDPPVPEVPTRVAVPASLDGQMHALEELDRLTTQHERLGKLWFSIWAGIMVYHQVKAEGRSPDFIDSEDLRRKMGGE